MTTNVLAGQFGANEGGALWARRAGMVVLGVAALWISAKTKVEIGAVPITMQVLVIMAMSMAYGSRMAAATLIAYLAAGAAGWPVFAGTPEKGIGLVYMLGSTGGYLVGFVGAAWLVGWLAERGWDRNMFTTALTMALGLTVIYACGVLWLAYGFPITAFGSSFAGFGIGKGLEWGVFPFLWIDAIKVALAVIAFPAIWKLIGNRGV
ncbi:MAG: biotin transporter BioY [Pikeienuella sp.]